MKKRSTIVLFVVMVFVLPISAWTVLNWYEKQFEALPVIGKSGNHTVDDFQLINQDGLQRTVNDWNGKIVVVDFFFTHCSTICPKMTNSMKIVDEAFKDDQEIRMSSFSVDPQRDSTMQLTRYAERFAVNTKKWDLLTGDKKEIYKLARNSFMIVATDGDGGPNDFIHSEKLVLIDQQKRVRGYYDGTDNKEVNQLIKDIKKLKHEE